MQTIQCTPHTNSNIALNTQRSHKRQYKLKFKQLNYIRSSNRQWVKRPTITKPIIFDLLFANLLRRCDASEWVHITHTNDELTSRRNKIRGSDLIHWRGFFIQVSGVILISFALSFCSEIISVLRRNFNLIPKTIAWLQSLADLIIYSCIYLLFFSYIV